MHDHPRWLESYARSRHERLMREAAVERLRSPREMRLRARLAAHLRAFADRLEAPTQGRLA